MRISWLSAEEIAAAREALTRRWRELGRPLRAGRSRAPLPDEPRSARLGAASPSTSRAPSACRRSCASTGSAAARARFAGSDVAIEAATLAAAAHEDDALDLDQVHPRAALRDRRVRVLRAVPRADDRELGKDRSRPHGRARTRSSSTRTRARSSQVPHGAAAHRRDARRARRRLRHRRA